MSSSANAADNNPYQFITLNQSPRDRSSRNYVLKLRQQPKHSRMCGFGEKVDRRPLDPPPIIQLEIQNTTSADENSYLYNPYYFMYASLISPDSEEELHLLRDGKTRSTTGSIVSSLYRLKDLDNKDGAFFVFPDLSVRMEGTYRLKFSLFEIVNTEIYYCTSICSDVFNVYPAKKFPGMEESTFLSRTFAEQGLKIRIRKELRMRKGRGKKGADMEGSPEASRKRGRKKGRRGSEDGSGSESGYSDDNRQEGSQRRRLDRAQDGTPRDDKPMQGAPAYSYDRGYDPSRPSNAMQHPHYGHMPHDPSGHAPYPYGMPGMQPKVWQGYSEPHPGGAPPYGYPPMPNYDPNVPYAPPPVAGPPPGAEHGAPDAYDPNQRHAYPPHHYTHREMDWHHHNYRYPGYGPGPYMGGHGYEDPQARPAAPTPGGAPISGDHAGAPPPQSGPYYGHQPQAGKPGEYKPPTYPYGQNFHAPQQSHPAAGDMGAARPPPPQADHAHHMHGPPPHAPHYVAHPGYYAPPYPHPPPTTNGAGVPQQPGMQAMPYGYAPAQPAQTSAATGNDAPSPGGAQQQSSSQGLRSVQNTAAPQKPGGDEVPSTQAPQAQQPMHYYDPQTGRYMQVYNNQMHPSYAGAGAGYRLPPITDITDKNRQGSSTQPQQQSGASGGQQTGQTQQQGSGQGQGATSGSGAQQLAG